MRAVAAEAGAQLATVHYCFEDKDALLAAAIQRWLRAMITDVISFSTEGGMRAAARQMVEAWWEALVSTPTDAMAQKYLSDPTSRAKELCDDMVETLLIRAKISTRTRSTKTA